VALARAEICQGSEYKLAKLRYWIHKQRHGETDRSGFIQLNGLPSAGISIRYPNGVELILPTRLPAGYIKMLINI